MTLQIRPWRYHLPIVSLMPRRGRREGMLRRCVGALQGMLADAIVRLRTVRPAAPSRRPEPPPIRWEM